MKEEISNKKLDKINQNEIPSLFPLIKNYLLYYGYLNTYRTFEKLTKSSISDNPSEKALLETLENRSKLRQLIMNGQPLEALKQTEIMYPGIFEKHKNISFMLQTQHFIELVKTNKSEEAIIYGRKVLKNSYNDSSCKYIQQICTLLCYPDPFNCPLSYLVEPVHAESVVDELNKAILEYTILEKNVWERSNLETLLKHLEELRKELRSSNNNIGKIFSVKEFMKNSECI